MRECSSGKYQKGEYYETGYGMAVYAVEASNEKGFPVRNSSWDSGKYIFYPSYSS